MRFNNPIHDHGFVFPDIADFPDVVNEPRYKGNGKEDNLVLIKDGIKNENLKEFERGYQNYMEKKPDTKLFQKLNAMFQFYNNFELSRVETGLPTNEIYEDLFENGISYRHANISELQKLLKDDIKNFEIEGMRVGESALNYFTKEEIENGRQPQQYPGSDRYIISNIFEHLNFEKFVQI